jgi:hypothetical protein
MLSVINVVLKVTYLMITVSNIVHKDIIKEIINAENVVKIKKVVYCKRHLKF